MFIVPLQHNSDRATLLDGNCTCCVLAKFKASSQLKNPLGLKISLKCSERAMSAEKLAENVFSHFYYALQQ